MELRRYAHLLRRRLLLVVLAVAVGVSAGYVISDRTTTYQAQATIYVGSRQFSGIADATTATAAMERLTQTFAAMIKSNPVAAAAVQLANAPRTTGQVVAATSAAAVPNANYIRVTVNDTDAATAQSLADGVAQSFVTQVQNLEPVTAGGPAPPLVASVFQRAARPAAPLPKSTVRNMVLGGLFGLTAGIAVASLLNYLDVTVATTGAIERGAGLPVLGTIPNVTRAAAGSEPRIAPPEPAPAPG